MVAFKQNLVGRMQLCTSTSIETAHLKRKTLVWATLEVSV